MRRASVQTIDVTEEFIDAFKKKKKNWKPFKNILFISGIFKF